MARCASCSAPLPANSQVCSYCGVRNDVDLRGKLQYQVVEHQSERQCPQCAIALQTLDLKLGDPFLIERCGQCFGLFFDPGEIEILLTSAVSPVFSANIALLDNINKDRFRANKVFKYLKCPVCQTLMNRTSYGHRSGVVIDHCKIHGVWLEGGEISHLLEWKKAGGQLLQQKQTDRKPIKSGSRQEIDALLNHHGKGDDNPALIESVASLVFKLFF